MFGRAINPRGALPGVGKSHRGLSLRPGLCSLRREENRLGGRGRRGRAAGRAPGLPRAPRSPGGSGERVPPGRGSPASPCPSPWAPARRSETGLCLRLPGTAARRRTECPVPGEGVTWSGEPGAWAPGQAGVRGHLCCTQRGWTAPGGGAALRALGAGQRAGAWASASARRWGKGKVKRTKRPQNDGHSLEVGSPARPGPLRASPRLRSAATALSEAPGGPGTALPCSLLGGDTVKRRIGDQDTGNPSAGRAEPGPGQPRAAPHRDHQEEGGEISFPPPLLRKNN